MFALQLFAPFDDAPLPPPAPGMAMTPASRVMQVAVGTNARSERLVRMRQPYDFSRHDELDFAFEYVFPDNDGDVVAEVELLPDPGLEVLGVQRTGNRVQFWVRQADGAELATWSQPGVTAVMTSTSVPPRRLAKKIPLRILPAA